MRASDTGESTTSIVRRGDDEAWRKIVVGLACSGHAENLGSKFCQFECPYRD